MKTLITGASGFLGRAVMERWRELGHVTGLGHAHAGGDLTALDLREPDRLGAFVQDLKPEVVIHCAAYRDPDWCEKHPDETRRLNVAPVRTLLDALPASARFLLVSSDYVFDGKRPPYAEDADRTPVNLYGQSKKEAEDIALSRASSIVLRVPLLMGAGPTYETSGYIYKTAEALLHPTSAEIDDLTMRYPTDIGDVADVMALLVERAASGIFHFSGVRGKTPYGWMLELAELMDVDTDALMSTRSPAVRPAERPVNSALACDKIRALGVDRYTDFQEVARAVLALRPKG